MPVKQQILSQKRWLTFVSACALSLSASLKLPALASAPLGLGDPSNLNEIKDSDITTAKASALLKTPPLPRDGAETAPDAASERPSRTESEPKGDEGQAVRSSAASGAASSGKLEVGGVSQSQRASDADAWSRYYQSGLKELRERRFDVAEDRLNAALKAARLGMGDERKLLLSRVALAQVFVQKQKYVDAEKLYTSCLSIAKRLRADSETATCKQGLAEVALCLGKPQQAETLIKEALEMREKISGPCAQTAECMVIKAQVLSKNNWANEAEETILSGISMMENSKDRTDAELAENLRQSGLLFQEHGRTQEAQDLYERSYRLLEEHAKLNMPPEVVGQLDFRWEQGSPRSLEIPDAEFTLKYLQLKNVRVAATIVDLWELYGVLISITNVGSERVSLGLGKPALFNTTSSTRPTLERLQIVDPQTIDRIRRERNMWDLTQNRPWLANMQKTRSQRGFVPPKGHDLFRGPNVFGVYGEWNALPRDLPEKLMLQPSPERVLYQAQTAIDPGLVRSSTIKVRNLVAVTLEPFESRTGELFFLNPRCEKLLLTVPVGNVSYQIPFAAKRKRIK